MPAHRWLLRLVSRLVPRELRHDWLDEWTAEIAYREQQRETWSAARRQPLDLLRRASGAFWDAMWLRTSRWYSLRLFGREWRLALTAVLSLATAIAALVIGLAAYSAFMFAPQGVTDPAGLRVIHVSSPGAAFEEVSFPEYRDYRDTTTTFSDIAAFPQALSGLPLTKDRFSFQVWTAEVSDNFFSVLGVRTERGDLVVRAPRAGSLDLGDVVISDALWHRLGADAGIVGSTIAVSGKTVRVAGVTAPGFRGMSFGFAPDVWLSFTTTQLMNDSPDRLVQADAHWLNLIGRLRPGVSAVLATTDAAKLAAMVDREPDVKHVTHRGVLSPMSVTPPDDRGWMMTLLGGLLLIVGLTLVVACANVTNLLLGLSVTRRHEMIVRSALGASRLQLVLPLLREGAMLGLAAGLVGCGAAWASLTKLATLDLSISWVMPAFSLDLRPGLGVWATALTIAIAAGAAASALPALRSAAEGAEGLIQREAPSTRRQARARRVLVGLQMVICTVVLAALGLAAHSLFNLRRLPLGFTARDLVYADVDVARTGFDAKTGPGFYRRLMEWMTAMPGVTAAGLASSGPLDGGFTTERVTSDADGAELSIPSLVVDDHYFSTIQMPLVAGRLFDSRDRTGSADVAIVNVTLARRSWPGRNPIGQFLRVGADHRRVEIIGVVPAGKYHDVDEDPQSMLYLPLSQHYLPEVTVIVRTAASMLAVEEHLSKLAPTPVMGGGGVFDLGDLLQMSMALPRAIVWAAMILGAVALGLTVFALYSTVFYSVSLRRAEIGIRTALGATPAQLFHLVLSESARVAALGAVLGLIAAALLTPLAASIFVGIDNTDPAILTCVAIVCAITTVLIALVVVRPWTRLPTTELLRP